MGWKFSFLNSVQKVSPIMKNKTIFLPVSIVIARFITLTCRFLLTTWHVVRVAVLIAINLPTGDGCLNGNLLAAHLRGSSPSTWQFARSPKETGRGGNRRKVSTFCAGSHSSISDNSDVSRYIWFSRWSFYGVGLTFFLITSLGLLSLWGRDLSHVERPTDLR